MVTAAIALIIASYGLTWPAIALFLAAMPAENISNILAHVTRRPDRGPDRVRNIGRLSMFGLALMFMILAPTAGLFGFVGIPSADVGIAQILLFIFLILD